MQPNKSNLLRIVTTIVLVTSAFFLGFFVRSEQFREIERVTEVSNKTSNQANVDFAPFWKAWRILNEKQINSNEASGEERLWSSIKGLTQAYNDPYTVFFPPEETKEFEMEISGNLEGVGMEVGMRDDVITIIAPLKGTPAERAGIRAGDKIIRINDESTSNMTVDDAVKLIRGKEGTTVNLTVFRENVDEALEFSIQRAKIQIPTLDTELRTDGVFVISLYNFYANAPDEFKAALSEFATSNSDKLLLDLRGNPGGYLTAATEIASYFLPSGKVIVREVGRGEKEIDVLRSRGYDLLAGKQFEMVILVDRGSASASEILAGALSEHDVATLVGGQTFGKGSVQEILSVTSDTSLKVTIAKWLTPNGTSISEGGLTPDVEIEWIPNPNNPESDNQLNRAVEILLNN